MLIFDIVNGFFEIDANYGIGAPASARVTMPG
ncbi:hypothetical protein GGR88_002004 [Sphingomonas jejuensis]|uniref:Uncharacterized protein n=1 Tax=Sphingomonas jejuensis TaxID=904715 RepID=A0ABX0XPA0_9SPHN|nr:hypothetical protein [Sphingomonas jejuensis]